MSQSITILRGGAIGLSLLAVAACGQNGAPTEEAAPEENETVAEPEISASDAFIAMVDDHAAQVLRESPEFATFLGVSEDVAGAGYNGRLGDYGFEANQSARQLNESFLQDIRGVELNELEGVAATTYEVLRDAYQTGAQRNQFDFGGATPWGSASPYVSLSSPARISFCRACCKRSSRWRQRKMLKSICRA